MSIDINVSGVWKTPDPSINVSGVWKTPDSASINVSGVWKEVWTSGPSVSPRADGDYNYRYNSTCYQGCYFYSNGNEYELTSSGSLTNTTTWLDSGTGSEVWVEFIRTGGSRSAWASHSNSTRYQLSSNRNFYYTVPAIGYNVQSLDGYFRMWDAATGGSTLWTGSTVGWDADAESAGGCPLCCFTPETPVTLASGLEVPIKDVHEGDKIKVYDPVEERQTYAPVTKVIIRENVPLFKITFQDRTIRVSPDHPFHTRSGPKSIGPHPTYKFLGETESLRPGDEVLTIDGTWTRVVKIERVSNVPHVYTFKNSYFYANGLLVY